MHPGRWGFDLAETPAGWDAQYTCAYHDQENNRRTRGKPPVTARTGTGRSTAIATQPTANSKHPTGRSTHVLAGSPLPSRRCAGRSGPAGFDPPARIRRKLDTSWIAIATSIGFKRPPETDPTGRALRRFRDSGRDTGCRGRRRVDSKGGEAERHQVGTAQGTPDCPVEGRWLRCPARSASSPPFSRLSVEGGVRGALLPNSTATPVGTRGRQRPPR